MIVLTKYIVQEFELHNELNDRKPGSIQLNPHINMQVMPIKDAQPVICEMTVEIGSMDDATPLYIKLRLRGIFSRVNEAPVNEESVKQFHRVSFPILFDIARSYMAGATLMAGMAPFNLPPINPDNINIERKS